MKQGKWCAAESEDETRLRLCLAYSSAQWFGLKKK